jgi:hypothetical protein
MNLADFNPSILFLLLWGLLSWFTKKKKKDSQKVESESPQPIPEKENIFASLQKLQDHLANKVDILPLRPEEECWEEDEIDFQEEAEPVTVKQPSVSSPIVKEVVWDGSTPLVAKKPQINANTGNWLSSVITDKNNIKKTIVLNEILGKPRGLKPY